jgi:hypothetical protein
MRSRFIEIALIALLIPALLTWADHANSGEVLGASANDCDPDTTPPVITCPPNVVVPINCPSAQETFGDSVSATDNCSAEILIESRDTIPDDFWGGFQRIWRATDEAGNWSECTQSIGLGGPLWEMITCSDEPIYCSAVPDQPCRIPLDVADCLDLEVWISNDPPGSVFYDDFAHVLYFEPSEPGIYEIVLEASSRYQIYQTCSLSVVADVVSGIGDPPFTSPSLQLVELRQNCPNPFNGSTEIVFEMSVPGMVELSIYNSLGQIVCTDQLGFMTSGTHSWYWDGTDNAGRAVQSGVYLYRLKLGSMSATRKMLLLK